MCSNGLTCIYFADPNLLMALALQFTRAKFRTPAYLTRVFLVTKGSPLKPAPLLAVCVVHSPGSAGTAYTAAHVVLPLLGRSLRANGFVSGLDFWERLGVALDVSSCIIANVWAGDSSLSVCFAWNCSCQRANVKGHKTFVWKWLPFSALSWSLLHKTPCNLEDPYPIPREFITF